MLNKAKTISTAEKLQRLDEEIRRVHGRMFRWANRLDALIKARTRLVRIDEAAKAVIGERFAKENEKRKQASQAETDHLSEKQFMEFVERGAAAQAAVANARINDDPLDIRNTAFRRSEADDEAKADIIAAQQAKAKAKAKASSEKSRAKKRGELRKMPLQGKAALAAIRDAK